MKEYSEKFQRIDIVILNPKVAAIFKKELERAKYEETDRVLRNFINKEAPLDDSRRKKFLNILTEVAKRKDAFALKIEVLMTTKGFLQGKLTGDEFLDFAKVKVLGHPSSGWKLVGSLMIIAGLALLVATATLGGGAGLAMGLGAGGVALTAGGLHSWGIFKKKKETSDPLYQAMYKVVNNPSDASEASDNEFYEGNLRRNAH